MSSLTFFNNKNSDLLDRFFGFDDYWTRPYIREVSDHHKPSIKEQEDKYDVTLVAPGLDKKDFSITLEGNRLTISYDAGEKKKDFAYATKYSKSYTIPTDCDIENIIASYTNGVLVVSLPKTESAKPRTIKIK